jgi:hypothetical protein
MPRHRGIANVTIISGDAVMTAFVVNCIPWPGPPHQFTVVSCMSQLRWSESQGAEPHYGSNVAGPMPGRVTLRRRIASLKSSCHALCHLPDACAPHGGIGSLWEARASSSSRKSLRHLCETVAQAMTRVPSEQAVPTGSAPAADSGDVKTNPVLTLTSDEVPAV